MSKQIYYLVHDSARRNAMQSVKDAPNGYIVEIKPRTRSLEQSAKFHAICGDLAKSSQTWAGKRRTLTEWKFLLVSGHAIATKEGTEIIPGLEGEFLNIRESTATMTAKRSASLIEYAIAFCIGHDVKLYDQYQTNS